MLPKKKLGGYRPGSGAKPRFPGQPMRLLHMRVPELVIQKLDAIKHQQRLNSRTDVILWLLEELPE